jgi:putative MATE family efflux protein
VRHESRSREVADRILRRGPFLAVLLQGLPLAFGLASHALVNIVDLLIVGRLGGDAVQSAHIGSMWNFLPMIVGQCVSTALLVQLSRRLGDGEVGKARGFNVRAQWFMVWLGIAVSVLTALLAAWQVDGTGVVGQVRDDAVHYLVVSNLGCLSMFVLMQTTAAMRAVGEAWMPLVLLLGANVLNLGLDIVLLFGWPELSIPAVGVVGAAYASVASRTLAALCAIWWLRRRQHQLSLRRDRVTGVGSVARPLLKDSWPQAIQIGLRAGTVIALTVLVQREFGDDATVSLGITTRLDSLVLFSSLGFANAATVYAGRAVAAGQHRNARRAGMWAAVQSMVFGAVFIGLYVYGGDTLVGSFLVDPSARVLEYTAIYFGIAAWGQILGAGALGAIGAVQGAGSMIAPMLVDVGGFAVCAGALWWVALQGGELRSFYWALVLGMGVVLLGQLLLVARGRWAVRG